MFKALYPAEAELLFPESVFASTLGGSGIFKVLESEAFGRYIIRAEVGLTCLTCRALVALGTDRFCHPQLPRRLFDTQSCAAPILELVAPVVLLFTVGIVGLLQCSTRYRCFRRAEKGLDGKGKSSPFQFWNEIEKGKSSPIEKGESSPLQCARKSKYFLVIVVAVVSSCASGFVVFEAMAQDTFSQFTVFS